MKPSTTRAVPMGRLGLFAFVALAFLPMACGETGPEMARVSGKVTYNGKPVPKGTVTFVSSDPERRNATGEIGPDGSFALQTENPGDGAQVGEYTVTVYAHDEEVLDYIPKEPVKPKILAPSKYEDPQKSGLKETVKSGSNTFDFDLKD